MTINILAKLRLKGLDFAAAILCFNGQSLSVETALRPNVVLNYYDDMGYYEKL